MSSINIANKSDEWMFDLEVKAEKIGLNRKEQKQYMKIEEIRDKYYEMYSKKFDRIHKYDSGNPKNGGSGICNCTLNLPEIR
jgi:hypothetical protein